MQRSRIRRAIFRAYDIRGRAQGADPPLTPALARRIGQAYAEHIAPTRQVVIGGDQRVTTPALKQAVIAGLIASGVDVIDVGRAPSPLAYWSTALRQIERPTGGIVITASHNPPTDNGIKLLEAGGMPLLPESIQWIADRIEQRLDQDAPPASNTGSRAAWDPKPEYLRELGGAHRLRRRLTVAIDPGNGITSVTAARALTAIGADVLAINDDPNLPPAHPADPQHPENVAQLADFVQRSGADLGFAFDGDGDRLGLVDGRGRRATPDQALAILAQEWLRAHPGAEIHLDVKTSQAVVDHVRRLGGRARFGPVGHSLGKYSMQAHGIDFGGEGSTHYFYRLDHPPQISDDAVRTACRLAQFASETNLEALLDRVPRYYNSQEVKVPCPDERKHAAAARIAEDARRQWPVNDIDGARIDLSTQAGGDQDSAPDSAPDNAWCLVRASNTTPCLTVVVEGRTRADYKIARDIAGRLLREQGLDPTPLLNQPPLR